MTTVTGTCSSDASSSALPLLGTTDCGAGAAIVGMGFTPCADPSQISLAVKCQSLISSDKITAMVGNYADGTLRNYDGDCAASTINPISAATTIPSTVCPYSAYNYMQSFAFATCNSDKVLQQASCMECKCCSFACSRIVACVLIHCCRAVHVVVCVYADSETRAGLKSSHLNWHGAHPQERALSTDNGKQVCNLLNGINILSGGTVFAFRFWAINTGSITFQTYQNTTTGKTKAYTVTGTFNYQVTQTGFQQVGIPVSLALHSSMNATHILPHCAAVSCMVFSLYRTGFFGLGSTAW